MEKMDAECFLSILWDSVNLRKPIRHSMPCVFCAKQHFFLLAGLAQTFKCTMFSFHSLGLCEPQKTHSSLRFLCGTTFILACWISPNF